MGASFRLTGVEEMRRKLRAKGGQVSRQIDGAVYRQAERVMTISKRDKVPRDLGTLAATGHVDPPRRIGRHVSVTLRYGGPTAPYALAVHEHPSSASPPSWEGKAIGDIHGVRTGKPWSLDGRGPKYLERPLMEAIPGMLERMAKDLFLGKGGPAARPKSPRARDERGRFI